VIEYPKMLFRLGDGIEWEGLKLATIIVQSAEHEAEAIAAGWRSVETILKGETQNVAAKKAKIAK
jgi:hypothetical protein